MASDPCRNHTEQADTHAPGKNSSAGLSGLHGTDGWGGAVSPVICVYMAETKQRLPVEARGPAREQNQGSHEDGSQEEDLSQDQPEKERQRDLQQPRRREEEG